MTFGELHGYVYFPVSIPQDPGCPELQEAGEGWALSLPAQSQVSSAWAGGWECE